MKQFQKLDTTLLAISVDPVAINKKLRKKLGLTFELLSDPNLEVIKKYGLVHEKPMGIGHPIARPAEFLIDQQGKIFRRWLTESIIQRTRGESILKELERLSKKIPQEISNELPSKKNVISAKSKAPDFSLVDTTGKKRSLSEFLGKKNVILTFYRGYWSDSCKYFLDHLHGEKEAFQKYNTTVLAISSDSKEANRALKEKLGLNFEILSDPTLKTIKAYGLLHKKPKGLDYNIARPGEFLIDQKGVIFQGWLPDSADKRTKVETMVEDVKRLFQAQGKQKK